MKLSVIPHRNVNIQTIWLSLIWVSHLRIFFSFVYEHFERSLFYTNSDNITDPPNFDFVCRESIHDWKWKTRTVTFKVGYTYPRCYTTPLRYKNYIKMEFLFILKYLSLLMNILHVFCYAHSILISHYFFVDTNKLHIITILYTFKHTKRTVSCSCLWCMGV